MSAPCFLINRFYPRTSGSDACCIAASRFPANDSLMGEMKVPAAAEMNGEGSAI